jgi:LysM repeat protein
MTTAINTALLERHQAMQAQLASQPDALETETILQFIEEARAAGARIADVGQREQLRAILRHWGGILFDRLGDYPAIQLTPFEGLPISEPSQEGKPVKSTSGRWRPIAMGAGVGLILFLLIALAALFGLRLGDGMAAAETDPTVAVSQGGTEPALGAGTPSTATPTPPPTPTRRITEEAAGEEPGDSDSDGLSDEDEAVLGTNPYSPDSDGDGLWDIDELDWGTDPLNFDTDGDGLLDGEEIEMGTDPLAADSDGDGLVDGQDDDPERPSTPTSMPSATPLPPTETATPQTAVPHTVQAGETLETIAGQYDVSVAQIAELNDLSLQDRLQAGQQVFVPLNPGFIIPELVIKIPAVNLRSGPGIEYTIIAYPERGTFATILGQTIDPTWYLVELQDSRGTRGWLSAVVVRLLYPTRPETIPLVATVPPTPVQ